MASEAWPILLTPMFTGRGGFSTSSDCRTAGLWRGLGSATPFQLQEAWRGCGYDEALRFRGLRYLRYFIVRGFMVEGSPAWRSLSYLGSGFNRLCTLVALIRSPALTGESRAGHAHSTTLNHSYVDHDARSSNDHDQQVPARKGRQQQHHCWCQCYRYDDVE